MPQYLHRVYGHVPVARLRNILEYYRVGEIIEYPGTYQDQITFDYVCDICLRTGQGTVVKKGQLDSGVFVGDHHACILQGPYSPAMITGNTYRFGILEYKSKHVKMYFIKSISEVSKCLDDYCRAAYVVGVQN